jgi:negative regulator of sigma-B (phosphoserine phosphatase)
MTPPPAPERSSECIEWGVASRAFRGEAQSGDLHVIAPFQDGVLAAAIDGLGHGPEAARAARSAADVLAGDPGLSVGRLVERCHAALRGTRGAVMTVAAFDVGRDRLTWTAIGNVEATLCRGAPDAAPARETVVPRGGVVGYQLPALREVSLPIVRGDVLILATDGVSHDFVLEPLAQIPAQHFADHLLDRYGKTTDDALVLVVRYLGLAS